jgi:allophanate hydrolase subunit 1
MPCKSREGVGNLVKIIPASDSSLLVVFGNEISPALHQRVMSLFHAFQSWHDPRIRNLHPGYASLLIDFDPLRLTHDELKLGCSTTGACRDSVVDTRANVVTIPVCYDIEFGPDLLDVAQHAGLSLDEVVRQHSPQRISYISSDSLRVSLPGWVAGGSAHAPARDSPAIRCRRKCWDCRQSNGNLSG